MEQKDFVREPAKRIFAREFNMSKYDLKPDTNDGDDKSPTFVITPTGALANRIIISGVLTSKDKKTEPHVEYTGIVNDNTGEFKIKASHFNPQAQQQMALIKDVPTFVTVIGKPSLFKPDDGRVFASVRVESINVTDKLTRDLWILDTAFATIRRIELIEDGTDAWIKEVIQKYNPDVKVFRDMVQNTINQIVE